MPHESERIQMLPEKEVLPEIKKVHLDKWPDYLARK